MRNEEFYYFLQLLISSSEFLIQILSHRTNRNSQIYALHRSRVTPLDGHMTMCYNKAIQKGADDSIGKSGQPDILFQMKV